MPKRSREQDYDEDEPSGKRIDHRPQHIDTVPELTDLLSSRYEPIRERILHHTDTKSVLALSSTNRQLRASIRESEFNINVKLKRFVQDPYTFRTLLGHAGGLISGSFALQFFERVVWPETELDVFLDEGLQGALLEHLQVH